MRSTSQEFFQVLPVKNALANLITHCSGLSADAPLEIATMQALHRILATAPQSPIDLPQFARSTMDGYAVRAADTFGASSTLPAYLRRAGSIAMGQAAESALQPGQALEIYTGAMLPPGADAVVMIERTQAVDEQDIEVLAPVAPGENVVQIGEDVKIGEEILPIGHRLRAQDLGGLLGVGILRVQVRRPLRIGLVSSGDELVPPDESPTLGQVRDMNSYTLRGLIQTHFPDAVVTVYGIAQDTFDSLLGMAESALAANDVLILTAGSSVSTRDLTRDVIERLGKPGVLQHGLAVKPGKPTIIAACDQKPVIGLPGNPVSALLAARQLIIPLLRHMVGENAPHGASVRAELTQNIASATGREDTVPVRLIERDGKRFADPVFGKSNLIYTLIKADGVVEIPLNLSGIKAGQQVDVMLF